MEIKLSEVLKFNVAVATASGEERRAKRVYLEALEAHNEATANMQVAMLEASGLKGCVVRRTRYDGKTLRMLVERFLGTPERPQLIGCNVRKDGSLGQTVHWCSFELEDGIENLGSYKADGEA